MKRFCFFLTVSAFAQQAVEWPVGMTEAYTITPNITYGVQSNFESKLDVYMPRRATSPTPTLIYIHGGGWVAGSKESAFFQTMPYLPRAGPW